MKPLSSADELESLQSGDFVEFDGVLTTNPLVNALEAIVSLMELVLPFTEDGQQGGRQSGGKNRRRNESENQTAARQLRSVIEGLRSGGTLEVVADVSSDHSLRAVLSSRIDYYLDRNADAIIDGQFRILGKVVRVLASPEDTPINLLRKTPLASVGRPLLDPLVATFGEMEGLSVPEVTTEIPGPACQVVPVAIFT